MDVGEFAKPHIFSVWLFSLYVWLFFLDLDFRYAQQVALKPQVVPYQSRARVLSRCSSSTSGKNRTSLELQTWSVDHCLHHRRIGSLLCSPGLEESSLILFGCEIRSEFVPGSLTPFSFRRKDLSPDFSCCRHWRGRLASNQSFYCRIHKSWKKNTQFSIGRWRSLPSLDPVLRVTAVSPKTGRYSSTVQITRSSLLWLEDRLQKTLVWEFCFSRSGRRRPWCWAQVWTVLGSDQFNPSFSS